MKDIFKNIFKFSQADAVKYAGFTSIILVNMVIFFYVLIIYFDKENFKKIKPEINKKKKNPADGKKVLDEVKTTNKSKIKKTEQKVNESEDKEENNETIEENDNETTKIQSKEIENDEIKQRKENMKTKKSDKKSGKKINKKEKQE